MNKRFSAWFRKDAEFTFRLFFLVGTLMWLAVVLDVAFGLGWGWDEQDLWVIPLILLFGTLLRLWQLAFLSLMDRFFD